MSLLKQEKIWDPVIRLWHWVLVCALVSGWSFGKFMSFDSVVWHFYMGYLVLALVGLRIVWGLLGPATVRLRALIHSPADIFRYAKTLPSRSPSAWPGHNPLGSLWILCLLVLLILQGGSGLFLEAEDFFEYGPLNGTVSEDTVKWLYGWHYRISNVLLGMVILHIAVLVFYRVWKKEDLIKPMFTGWKWVRPSKH